MGKLLSEQIRAAILDSGLSRYRIAKELGVSQALLSKFMNEKGGLSIEVIDQLGELLGLAIVVRRKPRKAEV
jgi:predicted transcriptional regulator